MWDCVLTMCVYIMCPSATMPPSACVITTVCENVPCNVLRSSERPCVCVMCVCVCVNM